MCFLLIVHVPLNLPHTVSLFLSLSFSNFAVALLFTLGSKLTRQSLPGTYQSQGSGVRVIEDPGTTQPVL